MAASAAQLDPNNLYVEDVERAQRALARSQERVAVAAADVQSADAQLPGAGEKADRLRGIADRRQDAASRVEIRAHRAEEAVTDRREGAVRQLRAAQERTARR